MLINVVLTLFYSVIAGFDPLPVAADKNATDFAAALTRAVVSNDVLELTSCTFFGGNFALGSKLFIRSCYKEMTELILSRASSGDVRDVVVTGTPGTGKSMFGIYLLYLLRIEGKTVIFDLKGDWYRFSDEGVVKGELSSFKSAGYLNDDYGSWYLSDPEWSPYEKFGGVTVVLGSPRGQSERVFEAKDAVPAALHASVGYGRGVKMSSSCLPSRAHC